MCLCVYIVCLVSLNVKVSQFAISNVVVDGEAMGGFISTGKCVQEFKCYTDRLAHREHGSFIITSVFVHTGGVDSVNKIFGYHANCTKQDKKNVSLCLIAGVEENASPPCGGEMSTPLGGERGSAPPGQLASVRAGLAGWLAGNVCAGGHLDEVT